MNGQTVLVSALTALVTAVIMIGGMLAGHHHLESMGEDQSPVWICETMGNHECGPDQPKIDVQWGER